MIALIDIYDNISNYENIGDKLIVGCPPDCHHVDDCNEQCLFDPHLPLKINNEHLGPCDVCYNPTPTFIHCTAGEAPLSPTIIYETVLGESIQAYNILCVCCYNMLTTLHASFSHSTWILDYMAITVNDVGLVAYLHEDSIADTRHVIRKQAVVEHICYYRALCDVDTKITIINHFLKSHVNDDIYRAIIFMIVRE